MKITITIEDATNNAGVILRYTEEGLDDGSAAQKAARDCIATFRLNARSNELQKQIGLKKEYDPRYL